ncbi:MAG: DUF1203 domain-containing protein [Pseudomonadota bacterium]
MRTVIKGMPTEDACHIQSGGLDANGDKPEIVISDGSGSQCRHCLRLIEEGEEMYVLSYKPFETSQPYAERGPIFLHARNCKPHSCNGDLPDALKVVSQMIVRGYNNQERIVYGTGKVVPQEEIQQYASDLLAKEEVEFVHVRSSGYNCFQARIDRA